jgi:hypothetical protein
MAAIEFNWQPSDRQLRQFGGVALLALPLIAFLLSGRPDIASWQPWQTLVIGGAAAVGALLAIAGWFWPQAIKPVFIGACLLAFPIGMVISEIILLVIYLVIFTPVAILFRLLDRDALERQIHRDQSSYWQPKKAAAGIRSYFRQS